MKKINKKHLVVWSILAVFGIAALTIWNTAQGKNPEKVFIENKTRSLQVESITEPDGNSTKSMIEVSLRNNYDKAVAAYSVKVIEDSEGQKNEYEVERGGLIAGWVLKPKEVNVEKFMIDPKGKTYLTLAAVIFEDGTGDGEIKELTRLQEIRAGLRMGFEKIASIIQDALKTGESFSSETIGSLDGKIKILDDEDVPDNSKRGFALAKSYISLELKDIKDRKDRNPGFNSNTDVKSKLTEIESALTKLLAN